MYNRLLYRVSCRISCLVDSLTLTSSFYCDCAVQVVVSRIVWFENGKSVKTGLWKLVGRPFVSDGCLY